MTLGDVTTAALSTAQSATLGQVAGLVGGIALFLMAIVGAIYFEGRSKTGLIAFGIAAAGAAAGVVIRLIQLLATKT